MNKTLTTFILLISFSLLTYNALSQCTPMTAEECPDPENNGQVCPDSLLPAYLHQYYSQVATILFPATYYLPPDSALINIYKVELKEVGNLPEGMQWQSNTTDSVFTPGNYYCILMEGQADSAGTYPLRITADVYVLVFNFPVKVATVTDSTSLNLLVIDDTGIHENNRGPLTVRRIIPNPFRSMTTIEFEAENAGPAVFEVFSLQGEQLYSRDIHAERGVNSLVYNGQDLSPGMYIYRLKFSGYQTSGIMIRSDQ
jgi:hypothetical protein